MARRFVESELRNAAPIWILDLTFAGRVWRFATEATTITIDGVAVPYDGTLSGVSFSDAVGFASQDFELPSASVSVVFREDIARLIQQGHDLSASRGELALWIPDSDHDDRRVVVEGLAGASQYGELGEPVSFSIEPDWLDNRSFLMATADVINKTNFPLSDDNGEGKAYPIVIGAPISPCYTVINSTGFQRAIVAGHRIDATTARLWRLPENDGWIVNALSTITDSKGKTVTVIENGLGGPTPTRSYFMDLSTTGAGLANPFKEGSALRTAGDVIRWALDKSGLKIDAGRTVIAARKLSSYQMSGFIGEIVDVMDWLKSEVLPILPVTLAASSDGVYPIVWDRRADPVVELEAGGALYRSGPVYYEDNEIRNEISLRWGYDPRNTDFAKRTTITGDQVKTPTDTLSRNIYSIASRTRYGSRAYELESTMVGDSATAGRILGWISEAYAFKHRSIEYRAPVSMAWLNAGDVVGLTDTGLSMANQRAIIRAVEWGENEIGLSLLLIPDAPRDIITL